MALHGANRMDQALCPQRQRAGWWSNAVCIAAVWHSHLHHCLVTTLRNTAADTVNSESCQQNNPQKTKRASDAHTNQIFYLVCFTFFWISYFTPKTIYSFYGACKLFFWPPAFVMIHRQGFYLYIGKRLCKGLTTQSSRGIAARGVQLLGASRSIACWWGGGTSGATHSRADVRSRSAPAPVRYKLLWCGLQVQ